MSALSKILRKQEGNRLAWWCPGCDEAHAICITAGGWTWDGNADAPTFSPSVKAEGFDLTPAGRSQLSQDQADGTMRGDGFTYDRVATVCHSLVKAGKMEFLNDCTHALAGHTVPIPNWPSDMDDDS